MHQAHTRLLTPMLLALLAVPVVASVQAEPAGNQYADVELVAAAEDFSKPFTVGLHFEMADGWHIYWKNPGEAGIPPRVEWSLPEGFTVSELAFPVPRTYVLGGIETFGYSQSALLTAVVTPPDGYQPTGGEVITANVTYLVCEEVCLPAAGEVSLPLNASGVRASLFDTWADRFPLSLEAAREAGVVRAAQVEALGKSRYSVRIDWATPVEGATFYPATTPETGVADVQLQQHAGQTRVAFTVETYGQAPASLETLLAYQDQQGRRHGVVVPVKLHGSTPAE